MELVCKLVEFSTNPQFKTFLCNTCIVILQGQGKANPIAAILSAAMMLKYSFNLPKEAENIENAVKKTLAKGCRTADIAVKNEKISTTKEIGDIIALSL